MLRGGLRLHCRRLRPRQARGSGRQVGLRRLLQLWSQSSLAIAYLARGRSGCRRLRPQRTKTAPPAGLVSTERAKREKKKGSKPKEAGKCPRAEPRLRRTYILNGSTM